MITQPSDHDHCHVCDRCLTDPHAWRMCNTLDHDLQAVEGVALIYNMRQSDLDLIVERYALNRRVVCSPFPGQG